MDRPYGVEAFLIPEAVSSGWATRQGDSDAGEQTGGESREPGADGRTAAGAEKADGDCEVASGVI